MAEPKTQARSFLERSKPRKKRAPGLAKRGRKLGRASRKRENAFRGLKSTVEEILRIAPAVDERLRKQLRQLQNRMEGRVPPPRKRKEEGV